MTIRESTNFARLPSRRTHANCFSGIITVPARSASHEVCTLFEQRWPFILGPGVLAFKYHLKSDFNNSIQEKRAGLPLWFFHVTSFDICYPQVRNFVNHMGKKNLLYKNSFFPLMEISQCKTCGVGTKTH